MIFIVYIAFLEFVDRGRDYMLVGITIPVQSVKKILNLWSYRDLTYIGKVTVIKTLARII